MKIKQGKHDVNLKSKTSSQECVFRMSTPKLYKIIGQIRTHHKSYMVLAYERG